MSGEVNSVALGKTSINAGHQLALLAGSVSFIVYGTAHASKTVSISADMSFGFDIDGGLMRHASIANLEWGFEATGVASRLKPAEVEAMTLLIEATGAAQQRMTGKANIPIELRLEDKMQFSHLHRAPEPRVMVVEAEVRSSIMPRERR